METDTRLEGLKEKIDAVGADTIMGSMAALNSDEAKERMEKLSEAVEESKSADQVAFDGNSVEALKRMGYIRKTRPIVRDNKKIGRNDPCPCGSGEKYKNCCMDSGKYETTHYE